MELKNSNIGDALVIKVSGRLDATSAAAFETHCHQAIDQGQSRLVLDFGGLEYLSSASLRSILGVAKRLKSVGGAICIANARGMVKDVLRITGFFRMIPNLDSLQVASSQPA